mmetsp:Transcript_4809/g.6719  ORF Transcript_4809/g.6719 Transcript_4809/m.6719 type:complete len:398 (-) Transcript_4809:127-1320(-)|eukprot:CAMPEP_0194061668 /NCGR_PEP_ID=MMETSP0009_2-20130614/75261_1 /TAXON_ID=210454 /ORGANISM="Grammatophora oceanica, Strain CCMP 410" /LENGTH=397 /DNA_ID=CAMNT_0038713089 /DNA_START=59 /DNA_END=1252 /DNA_ORIENTATION=-
MDASIRENGDVPDNIYETSFVHFTPSQIKFFGVVYYLTPPLSLLSSITVLYLIVKSKLWRTGNLNPTFLRLTIGFSIMDALQSLGTLVFGPWSIPAGSPFSSNAIGNVTTCNLNGFFTQLASGLWFYSAFFAVYHMLVVRYQWKSATISKYIEPFFHSIAWLYPILQASIIMAFDLMNPVAGAPGTCWATQVPDGCVVEDVECQRGSDKYGIIIATIASILIIMVVMIVSSILLYLRVRHIEQKIARFDPSGSFSSSSRMKTTRQTGRQAIRYILSFLACNLATCTIVFGPEYSSPNANVYYTVTGGSFLVLFPLQGLLHACIFIRTNQRRLWKNNGNDSSKSGRTSSNGTTRSSGPDMDATPTTGDGGGGIVTLGTSNVIDGTNDGIDSTTANDMP